MQQEQQQQEEAEEEIQERTKRKLVPSSPSPTQCQKLRPTTSSIGMYAVQCAKCSKWRRIHKQDEYEEIRKDIADDPWFCNKMNVSCEDPTEIKYDATRTWALDKANIPKTPVGFKRTLVVRSDFSKCDAYYYLPNGKKLRSLSEIEKFLEANPEYKSKVKISDFNFTVPKIIEETVPERVDGRTATVKQRKKEDDGVIS